MGTFSSLRVYNYRLYFFGSVLSQVGTWMQYVGQAWLILRLTGSGTDLGITTALQQLPMLLFGAWGGLIADRLDKRRVLQVTQSASGLLALILALLTFSEVVQVWMVYAIALGLGAVNSVDNPTRSSFAIEMVGADNLANAVALNTATFTAARTVGPAIAGAVIALTGIGWCFLINAASFAFTIGALFMMNPQELYRSTAVARARGQVRDGISYVWSRPPLRVPILVMAVVGMFAFNFQVVLSLMAKYSFRGGPQTLGLLLSAQGIGALVGALVAASRARPTHELMFAAITTFGLLMLAAAWAPTLALELVLLALVGAAMITFQASNNAMLQMRSDSQHRGRVQALFAMVFLGTTPFGGPLVGYVGQHYGARVALALGGVAALVAAGAAVWSLTFGSLKRASLQSSASAEAS
ncbi:MAG: MFS transporter [Candidatus Dormibacteraceae bacterium]